MLHIHSDRQTDRQTDKFNNATLNAPPNEEAFLSYKQEKALVACLIPNRAVNEARRPHTCSRPCAFEKTLTKTKPPPTRSRRTKNTPRNPQHPGDRIRLQTACNDTRSTREPILSRCNSSRVCAKRSRAALATSKNQECFHTHRQIQRDRLTD